MIIQSISKRELEIQRLELAKDLIKTEGENIIVSTGYIEELIGRGNGPYPINSIEVVEGKSGFKLMKSKEGIVNGNSIEYCLLKSKIKSVIDSIYVKDKCTEVLISIVGNQESKREIYEDVAKEFCEKYSKLNLKYEITAKYDCNKAIILKVSINSEGDI